MADAASLHAPQPDGATGVLVLADGTVIWGKGFGVRGVPPRLTQLARLYGVAEFLLPPEAAPAVTAPSAV